MYFISYQRPFTHFRVLHQKLRLIEQEKAERQRKRLEEIAARKAKEEAEKEAQFQKEQEVGEQWDLLTMRHVPMLTFFSPKLQQRLRRLEEEKADKHRKRLQELAEKKAKEDAEKERLFQLEQEV